MPKDTFHNLPAAKKQKIFAAAVREFSARRFSEASINQIVKAAGIPRGSFYQYFSGKEDLFLYMFETIAREKREIIGRTGAESPQANVFELCLATTRASFAWGQSHPEYIQISMLMEIDPSEFIAGLRTKMAEGLKSLIKQDINLGRIKPEIDADLLVDMIYTLLWKQFSLVGSDEALFFKRISEGLQIIRAGSQVS